MVRYTVKRGSSQVFPSVQVAIHGMPVNMRELERECANLGIEPANAPDKLIERHSTRHFALVFDKGETPDRMAGAIKERVILAHRMARNVHPDNIYPEGFFGEKES